MTRTTCRAAWAMAIGGLMLLLIGAPSAGAAPAAVAVTGAGDSHGYHVLAGIRSGEVVRWHDVAVLDPGGVRDRGWIGEQCVTPNGRYAAAVVLPLSAVNDPARQAIAYSVDLRSRRVRLLTSRAAFGYDVLGCGTGDAVVIREAQRSGSDVAAPQETTLRWVDLATGVAREVRVSGQVTSAVPSGADIVGARETDVVRIAGGHVATIATVGDIAYDIRATSSRSMSWLTTRFGSAGAALWQWSAAHGLRRIATGRRVGSALLGTGRHLAVSGLPRARLEPARGGIALATDGSFTVQPPASPQRPPHVAGRTALHSVRLPGSAATPSPMPGPPRVAAHAAQSASACAVARLDPRRQVLQPTSQQIDWATQMAARGWLDGGHARPADYANMGLAAYSANGDFPRIALSHPSGDTWDTVPRSVMEGIEAQESNWDQASFHALPGIAGDPLIADYYGSGGNAIDHIDFSEADCGYGLTQVTDGMRAGQQAPDLQAKIAVDYEANIAAGLRILEQKWNDLYARGIIANGGNPRYLENWYFALWAYNTGLQPSAAFGNVSGCDPGPACTGPDGTWGLGWLNNPNNPAYPPNRPNYLESSYADASHPADWPYQERVLGWMASPLQGFGAGPRYAGPEYHGDSTWVNVPAAHYFCSSENRCSGAGPLTPGTCGLADDECWWHSPASWVNCATRCATSESHVASGSPEPGADNPHPPTCAVSSSDVPSTAFGSPVIVDDLPDPEYNVVGCANDGRRGGGTFTLNFGSDGSGQPISAIDTHQLGAGFGGHIYFTHTEKPDTPSLLTTGTWTPQLPSAQDYRIKVHVPATGADAHDATYTVADPDGRRWSATIDQGTTKEAWLDLGLYPLLPGATVSLRNTSDSGDGSVDIAFDALAFIPEGARPDPAAEGQIGPPAAATATPVAATSGQLAVTFEPTLPQRLPRDGTAELIVRVTRSVVSPVSGVKVGFRIDTGPNSPRSLSATTNQQGLAGVRFQDRNGAGIDHVSARATDLQGHVIVAVDSVVWVPPVDCSDLSGKRFTVALRCAAARKSVHEVLKAAQCGAGIASDFAPELKILSKIKDAKSAADALKLAKTENAKAITKFLYDLWDTVAHDAPAAKASLKDVRKRVKAANSAKDVIELLPDLVSALRKKDFSDIALDAADILGVKPCAELVAGTVTGT